MKRLTKIYPSGSYGIVGDIDDVVHRKRKWRRRHDAGRSD